MSGEIWTKKYFGLKIKVHIVTDQFQPNVLQLYGVCTECHV